MDVTDTIPLCYRQMFIIIRHSLMSGCDIKRALHKIAKWVTWAARKTTKTDAGRSHSPITSHPMKQLPVDDRADLYLYAPIYT